MLFKTNYIIFAYAQLSGKKKKGSSLNPIGDKKVMSIIFTK